MREWVAGAHAGRTFMLYNTLWGDTWYAGRGHRLVISTGPHQFVVTCIAWNEL